MNSSIIPDSATLQSITRNFLDELKSSAIAPTGSLPFILHQLPEGAVVPENESFQVLVIGGSICKTARVVGSNGSISILQKQEVPQPVFTTLNDFLTFISNQLFDNVNYLAINFAYPLRPIFEEHVLDGVFHLAGTKEHAFEGLLGKMVGQTIRDYIAEKKNKKLQVSVANDTVCLLLSGLVSQKWENLAAGVVGTGLNFALFLERIRIVNLEAAFFDKFPMSEAGKKIDSDSQHPGNSLFEKEVSGAYLYQHFNVLAADQGLATKSITCTEELDVLARSEQSGATLARQLLERSASFVACQVAGITLFEDRDVTFVMEGSLFWNGWQYREHVESYVKLLTHHKVTFIRIEESGILGAAKLLA